MTKYIRVDHDKDYDWLRRIIENWLASDPNSTVLQVNFEHINAWNNYLNNNVVTGKEIVAAVDTQAVTVILPPEKVSKLVKPKEVADPPKRRGRPPSKASIAAARKKELAARKKQKLEHQKSLAEDPFRCPDHPTYHGKNKTSRDCDRCWEIYKVLHPHEYKVVRAAFERSLRKVS